MGQRSGLVGGATLRLEGVITLSTGGWGSIQYWRVGQHSGLMGVAMLGTGGWGNGQDWWVGQHSGLVMEQH